jgi:hypothetical protein
MTIGFVVHAEGKAGATLAGVGVATAVLLAAAHAVPDTPAAQITAGLSGLLFLLSGVFAAASLWTRSRIPAARNRNLIHFADVARGYRDDPDGYATALRALTADHPGLMNEVAFQIWANANVAQLKFRWANRGIASLLAGLLLLAATGLIAVARGH